MTFHFNPQEFDMLIAYAVPSSWSIFIVANAVRSLWSTSGAWSSVSAATWR